jgi:DnaK suppressor protein
MQTETSRGPLTGPKGDGPVPAGGPRWRALLEMRWRARLQEVTELALAYHEAAEAAAGHGTGGSGEGRLQVRRLLRLQRLLRRTVTSRRALADTEEALARLSAGRYGRCESCAGAIPARRLAATPETRYCARCARGRGR